MCTPAHLRLLKYADNQINKYTTLNLMDKDRFTSHNYAAAACRGRRIW